MPQEVKPTPRRLHMRYGGPVGLTESGDKQNWNYGHQASKGFIACRYPYEYSKGRVRELKNRPLLEAFRFPQNGIFTEPLEGRGLEPPNKPARCIRLLGPVHAIGELGRSTPEGMLARFPYRGVDPCHQLGFKRPHGLGG